MVRRDEMRDDALHRPLVAPRRCGPLIIVQSGQELAQPAPLAKECRGRVVDHRFETEDGDIAVPRGQLHTATVLRPVMCNAALRALPADAHRGRVARAARLRHDHQQPVRELGRRPAARRPRARLLDRRRRSLLCYGDHLGDPLLRERGRRRRRRARARRRARHAGRGGRAVRTATVAARAAATTPSSCAPTTPRTSRRRARSAPTSTSSTSRSTTAGSSTSTGSRHARPARRDQADLGHVPAQPDRHDARPRVRCTRSSSSPSESGAVLLVDETYRDLTHGEPAADGGDALAARDQRLVDVEGVRAARAARRLGRVPRSASSPRRCSRRRSRWSSAARRIDEAIAGRVLAERDRILPPILDDVRARLGDRARLDRRPGRVRVGRAGGRRRRARAVRARRRRRHRPLLRRAARELRHVRRARATGSRSTTATSASASAGPPTTSCAPASPRCPPPRPRCVRHECRTATVLVAQPLVRGLLPFDRLKGSMLSISSVGSFLSIGSVGSFASILSIGSAASIGSCCRAVEWSGKSAATAPGARAVEVEARTGTVPPRPLPGYRVSDQSSGLSSTKCWRTSPFTPSTSTRPRFGGGSSAE